MNISAAAMLLTALVMTGCSNQSGQDEVNEEVDSFTNNSFTRFIDSQAKLRQKKTIERLKQEALSKAEEESSRRMQINMTEKPQKKSNTRPYYESIPLDDDLLDYIWDLCQEHSLDYDLVLGLIKTESTFNPRVVSYNGTSVGLFQINKNTYRWLAREVGIENPDLRNPKHSAKMGIWYLSYFKQRWMDRGFDEKEAMRRSLLSYNRGEAGARRYIQSNGTSRSGYTKKVYENRDMIRGVR